MKLLSVKEAAEYLGVRPELIRAIIQAGEIAFHDRRSPGSTRPRYKVTPEELDRWVRSRHVRKVPRRPPRICG